MKSPQTSLEKGPTDEPTNFAHKPAHLHPEHVVTIHNFGRVKLRPISIEDENGMVEFHQSLSEENIYERYFEHISLDARTLHERLARVCANTADSFAIVAESIKNGGEILAVGRLTTTAVVNKASFALLVADRAKDTTLARELLMRLIVVARAYRFQTLGGEFLVADHDALNLCRDLGFRLHTVPEDGIVRVTYSL